jgi:hypothetical protein
MSSYDPQRNRPRQRPNADEPAAIDALLGTAPVPAQSDEHEHEHDHCEHDHDDHDDVALVPIVVVVGAFAGAWFLLRRLRRRSRGAGD